MTNKNDGHTYKKRIGSLDTKQFTTLQKFLAEVDVPERMKMLYNILEKDIEDGVEYDEDKDE